MSGYLSKTHFTQTKLQFFFYKISLYQMCLKDFKENKRIFENKATTSEFLKNQNNIYQVPPLPTPCVCLHQNQKVTISGIIIKMLFKDRISFKGYLTIKYHQCIP